ncbi:MAG TPA: hypothetical protein PLV92_27680, partial [Pirellulaceae bacterium]|nr:hypothetical protein [Pirellulaceae bacterium]
MCSLHRGFQPLAAYGEGAASAFFVARNVQYQTPEHFIAVDGRLDVLIMQQQPELETGDRGNGLKAYRRSFVI